MVKMAEPYRHPETGVFYLRRQIPGPLRSEFGGRQLHKETLGTKDAREAGGKFTVANAELEKRFQAAAAIIAERAGRDTLTLERAKALLDRKLASARGKRFPLLTNIYWSEEAAAAILKDVATVPMFIDASPEGIAQLSAEHLPGDLWLRFLRSRSRSETLFMADHLIAWVLDTSGTARDVGIVRNPTNDAMLVDAISTAVEREQGELRVAIRTPHVLMTTRLRPNMRLGELFSEWSGKTKTPSLQTVHEARTTVNDFIDFAGDLPVGLLTGDHFYNFRDAVASLPKAMPRTDRALPFNARVKKYSGHNLPPISPGSVKKRVGQLQALITFAFSQRWIATNTGGSITIEGYVKETGNRRPFLDDELARLFSIPLFNQPATWSASRTTVSDVTLFWLFILGLTNGARIEEIGQTPLNSIKVDGGVWYIDLGIEARVKNLASRRVIPIHVLAMQLGFARYVEALRRAGALLLFPDLTPKQFKKVSKEASRLANRLIDSAVGEDRLVTFHSLRHNFKDLARDKLIEKYIIDQLTGHAGVTAGDKYGVGARLKTLKRELDRIDFAMIDWQPLLSATRDVNWSKAIR